MEAFDPNAGANPEHLGTDALVTDSFKSDSSASHNLGSSIAASDVSIALAELTDTQDATSLAANQPPKTAAVTQDAISSTDENLTVNTQTVNSATLTDVTTVDPNQVEVKQNLQGLLGENGDVLDGGGGINTIVGADGSDVIVGNGEDAFNTIATGRGEDLIILGSDSTNRIFDFDPTLDRFGLTGDIPFDQIGFGQGTNPANGGLNQPLDSRNNTVVFNKLDDHILAALTFTQADDLSTANFVSVDANELAALTVSTTGTSA